VRNSANKDGLRTNENESGRPTAGFRFAFEQELLRDFSRAIARSSDLGWEFRCGNAASFGFKHCC